MTKEKKVHVLKDESLGGVKREYVEVERKAEVGNFVRIYEYADDFEDFIGRIDRVDSCNDLITYGHYNNRSDDRRDITEGSDKYYVLEPSNIVVIGGKRYRIEERLAEPGELILNKKNGLTYEVFEQKGDFIVVSGESQRYKLEEEYVVLDPVEKSMEDIIANLVRRVAELERNDTKHREVIESLGLEISNVERNFSELFGEVTGIKRDVETWAQEVESLKHVKESKQITLDIDTLAKLIGGVRG